jgi:putative endonuclease
MDRVAAKPATLAAHLTTGRRGEELAYFHLRRLGYTMIARNWRSPRRSGEIDLIGWDGDVLCFVEVKTRGSRDVALAEAAVDAEKRDELCGMARDFLRRHPHAGQSRFDVITLYTAGNVEPEIELFRDAFPLR